MEDKRVLVSGGAGFIGSHVTRSLLSRGADVHVLDNLHSGKREHVPDGAGFSEVDLRSDEAIDVVTNYSPDILVHLAALHYVPYCNDHPEETFDVNVMGTRRLLEAAQGEEVDKLVYTSSAAVYPPRDEAHSEDEAVGPTDVYGRTKLVGEELLRLHHNDTGADAVSLRVFNVYGPRETNPHVIPAIIEQLGGDNEIELGNLRPARDFVHVRDVASAVTTVLEEFEGGYDVFNVGTGRERSIREVVELTEEALGREIEVEQDQERMRESDRPHLEADVSKLTSRTGWRPETGFVEGLEELLEIQGVR